MRGLIRCFVVACLAIAASATSASAFVQTELVNWGKLI